MNVPTSGHITVSYAEWLHTVARRAVIEYCESGGIERHGCLPSPTLALDKGTLYNIAKDDVAWRWRHTCRGWPEASLARKASDKYQLPEFREARVVRT